MQINSSESLDAANKKYVFAVYILQALSFVFVVTSVVGVIINYIKDDDVRGSWLESHFLWQKRTFWYGVFWTVLGTLTIGFMVGWLVLGILTFWLIYRIAKGWIYLVDGKQLYGSSE
jgi:uncharacterized membrane protein